MTFSTRCIALGFLSRDGDVYSNTAETDLFLDRKKPSYVGGILEMANLRLYPFWGHLTEALHTGQPQNEIKTGRPGLFEGLYADPGRLKVFLAAMTGLSRGANLAIARGFPWKNYKTFVDVGTAQGDLRGAGRARQPASARARLRSGAGRPDLRGIRRDQSAVRSAHLRGGQLLRSGAAEDRGRDDGPHPARLGHADQEDADREGVPGASRRRRVHRLRVDHRRRPLEECVRADDEPEHADRDAWRLRLHRARTAADGCAMPGSARRASSRWSAPTRWSSASNSATSHHHSELVPWHTPAQP